jgi:nucleotide-binding universal stress UspA family protein
MFRKILVPIDLQNPSFSDRALVIALDELKAQTDGSMLCIMSGLPGFNMPLVASFFPKYAMSKVIDNADLMIKDYVKYKIPTNISYTTVVSVGTAHEKVLDQAKIIDADLIVMPSHTPKNHRSNQFLLGSCTHKVVEHAHCTVIVVRDYETSS